MTHVHAADTSSAAAAASTYICDCKASDPDDLRTIDRALAYIRATGRHREDGSRVAATGFVCRGSHSRQAVWRQVDDAFRTKTGDYSRRGGNNAKRGSDFKEGGTPRLAIFADGTLPYALSEEQKIGIATSFARLLVDRYGCAVEIALHKKDGLIDHAHWLISTRVVDEGGVGPVIREMNGIASKATSKTTDGWRRAGFSEFCRGEFARLLSEATGEPYDARSFRRQGREETPTPWLPRPEYEANRAAASVAERSGSEERARLDVTHPVRMPASSEREAPRRRTAVEAVATALLGSSLPNLMRSRSALVLALGTGSMATRKPIIRVPTRGEATVDLSGLDHEEINEAIIKAVDADLKADAAAFNDEQRMLDQQRGKAKPILHWGWSAELGRERQPMPSATATKNVERQPNPHQMNVAPASPVLRPLFYTTEEEEEAKKQRAQVEDYKRRIADVLDNASRHNASVKKAATAPSSRKNGTASAVASPPPTRASGKPVHRPSFETAEDQEEVKKRWTRGEDSERRAAEALDDAASRDASVTKTGTLPPTKMVGMAPAASPSPAASVRTPINAPADPRQQPPHRPTSSTERIDKSAAIDPLMLRRAAIAVGALTRKMPGDLAAVAGMTHQAFMMEVTALIHSYERAADRTAARRMLVERVQLSSDPRLLGLIAQSSTRGQSGSPAKVDDRTPQRERSIADEGSRVRGLSAADPPSKVKDDKGEKGRGPKPGRHRDPPDRR